MRNCITSNDDEISLSAKRTSGHHLLTVSIILLFVTQIPMFIITQIFIKTTCSQSIIHNNEVSTRVNDYIYMCKYGKGTGGFSEDEPDPKTCWVNIDKKHKKCLDVVFDTPITHKYLIYLIINIIASTIILIIIVACFYIIRKTTLEIKRYNDYEQMP